ncbi:MAG: TonB family protein [Cognaticolwellia sp.]|jgi:TonB family protein
MKPFIYIGIFTSFLLVESCSTTRPIVIDYSTNSPVKWQFQEGSEIILKTYNTSLEKTTSGSFIYKKYYPTTSVKTFEITYLDEAKKVKQGKFTHRYDNGNIWSTGNFVTGENHGEWKFYNSDGLLNKIGSFSNGIKIETWKEYSDSLLSIEYSFNKKGDLHGKYISYNKEGKIVEVITYEDGEVVKTKTYDERNAIMQYRIVEKMPLFGEECAKIKEEDLAIKCGQKALLTFIYNEINYPDFARNHNITGSVYTSFVIEPNGDLSEIQILNGLCDEIREECIRLLKKAQYWQPGYQNGEAVRVQFNLPIRFKIED